MDIKGVSAAVTGGGSGMGAAVARMLAAQGAKVALWDMNEQAAAAVAAEIGGIAVACDVVGEDSVAQALEKTAAAHGVPRVLVNCAGVLIPRKLVGRDGPADLAHFHKTIHVNLLGTYNTMCLAAAAMGGLAPVNDDGARGVIVNTASIAAFEGQMGQVAYSASKGGVVAMTLPAARDLARSGIRVMAVAPGAVQTPMIGTISDELQKSIESGIPFPSRFAKPEEFAKLVLHIIDNDMLNGEVIRLDGAARLAAK